MKENIKIYNEFIKKSPNELLEIAIKELNNLLGESEIKLLNENKNEKDKIKIEKFVIKDLFKGYLWNRIGKAERLRLGILFLNWVSDEGSKIVRKESKTPSGQQAYIKL